MKKELPVSANAKNVVSRLQEAGYETYIVGGAIRDMLMGRTPKDFDISTAATPEEIRQVFGRRSARIIGKRFRLAHVYCGGELFEVATFRRAPGKNDQTSGEEGNLIVSDNVFGTSFEDAARRDFTVNALFYDPGKREIKDFTGQGLGDIERGIVRAIGDPGLRFEEDPVRLLRALKLVGQYDFSLDSATENALFSKLPLFELASPSRRALELEKILQSGYGDRQLEAFHDYGLLSLFLPRLDQVWEKETGRRAMSLLFERNCRMEEGFFRNSLSLAVAVIALPFVEAALGRAAGTLWSPGDGADETVEQIVGTLFQPQNLMVRVREAACRILALLPLMEMRDSRMERRIFSSRSYGHARELAFILAAVDKKDPGELERLWPEIPPERGSRNRRSRGRRSR
ncbi:MAG: hypothetical protein IJS01_09690 [Lentisphaeria bacterium]|nr:hypothetical protein [Lentisphaeria bacterium]